MMLDDTLHGFTKISAGTAPTYLQMMAVSDEQNWRAETFVWQEEKGWMVSPNTQIEPDDDSNIELIDNYMCTVLLEFHLLPWDIVCFSSSAFCKVAELKTNMPAFRNLKNFTDKGDVGINLTITISTNSFPGRGPPAPLYRGFRRLAKSIKIIAKGGTRIEVDYRRFKKHFAHLSVLPEIELPFSTDSIQTVVGWMEGNTPRWSLLLVQELLPLSNLLHIASLRMSCDRFLCSVIDIHNCFTLQQMTQTYSLPMLKEALARFKQLKSTQAEIVKFVKTLDPQIISNFISGGVDNINNNKSKKRRRSF